MYVHTVGDLSRNIYLYMVCPHTHLQLVFRQDEFSEALTAADALWKMHEPILVHLQDGEPY